MVPLHQFLSVEHIANLTESEVIGDPSTIVTHFGSLDELKPGVLSFVVNDTRAKLLESRPGGVVFAKSFVQQSFSHKFVYLITDEPQLSFSKISKAYALKVNVNGVSPHAVIDPSAQLAQGVEVGAFTIIEGGVRIGVNTRIGPHCYIGPDVQIGEECEIFPRVTIMDKVVIGNRVKVFPGAVLGASGFGYFHSQREGGKLVEMPQIGTVRISDDVRIGVNTAIDRATLQETVVGQGTKIDNLVQIGHNVKIGKNCILCGCVGLSGSSKLGDQVVLGGGVGVGDGVNLESGVKLGGLSGVMSDLKKGDYVGIPAMPVRAFFKAVAHLNKLGSYLARIKRIEKKLGIDIGNESEGG